jgi:ketosteroid isomerase-like protein
MNTGTNDQTEANRETIREAFEAWKNGAGSMKMRDGKVIDGTAFYDSISFNELWSRVQPS